MRRIRLLCLYSEQLCSFIRLCSLVSPMLWGGLSPPYALPRLEVVHGLRSADGYYERGFFLLMCFKTLSLFVALCQYFMLLMSLWTFIYFLTNCFHGCVDYSSFQKFCFNYMSHHLWQNIFLAHIADMLFNACNFHTQAHKNLCSCRGGLSSFSYG